MASTRAPTLAETMTAAIRAGLVECNTAIPGRIVGYDAATQKADVKPLVKQPFTAEDGARDVASIPVIAGVPVMFPGAGGLRITFPVHASDTDGDTCLLVFSQASLDRWLSGNGDEVDPQIDTAHALTDAVAILGLRPFGAPLSQVLSGVVSIGKDDGTFVPAALGDAIKQQFDALKSYIDGHIHTVSGVGTTCVNGAPWTGTATSSAPSSASPSVPDVESDTVKVSR